MNYWDRNGHACPDWLKKLWNWVTGKNNEAVDPSDDDSVKDGLELTDQVDKVIDPLGENEKSILKKAAPINEAIDIIDISTTKNTTERNLKTTEFITKGLYPDPINPSKLMRTEILPALGGPSEKEK